MDIRQAKSVEMMNRRHRLSSVGLVLLFACSVVWSQDRFKANVSFLVGLKYLDKDDWGSLDNQLEYGLLSTFGRESWPVHIAVDYLRAEDRATEFGPFGIFSPIEVTAESKTNELDVGVRKIWRSGLFKPYVGGGLALVEAELETREFSVDDIGTGAWLNAGFFLGRGHVVYGIEARVSRADVNLAGRDVEAGGEHYSMFLGVSW